MTLVHIMPQKSVEQARDEQVAKAYKDVTSRAMSAGYTWKECLKALEQEIIIIRVMVAQNPDKYEGKKDAN